MKCLFCLEAPAVELDARIGNGDEPNVLVAGAHVGDVDAQGFQAILQLLNAEIVIAGHDLLLFLLDGFD